MKTQSPPIKILLIDDDEQIQFALKTLFSYQDWDTFVASDAQHGLALYQKHHPDLVIIDYHLPRISGAKVTETIRDSNPLIPLLILTSDDSQQVADRLMEAGASDFILKPIKALDMIARIQLHIRLLHYCQEHHESNPPCIKGIQPRTLQRITAVMDSIHDYLPVEDIAAESGLAYQTTYRYLQFMVSEGLVEVCQNYGKVGRPKQRYRLVVSSRLE